MGRKCYQIYLLHLPPRITKLWRSPWGHPCGMYQLNICEQLEQCDFIFKKSQVSCICLFFRFVFLLVVRFISAFFGISHLRRKIGRWTIGLTEYPYPKSRTPIFKFQRDRRRVSVGFYFEQKFGIPVMRETKSVLMFKLYIQTEMSQFAWFMVKKLCIKALFELFSLELGGFWRNSSPAFLWK